MINQKCKECVSFEVKQDGFHCKIHKDFEIDYNSNVICREHVKFKGMSFKDAFDLMKQGKAIKLPSWGGYWRWEQKSPGDFTIMMYIRDGAIMDIRQSDKMEYTIGNILKDDWMEATSENCPALRLEFSE